MVITSRTSDIALVTSTSKILPIRLLTRVRKISLSLNFFCQPNNELPTPSCWNLFFYILLAFESSLATKIQGYSRLLTHIEKDIYSFKQCQINKNISDQATVSMIYKNFYIFVGAHSRASTSYPNLYSV